MKSSSRHFYRFRGIPVFTIAFLAALFAGLGFTADAERRRFLHEQEQASSMVENQAGRISHVIDNLLSITQTLRALLEEGGGAIKEFDRLIPDIIATAPVRNVTLAPGGIVTTVYPVKGNEAAIGHNLLEDPSRALEAAYTKDSNKLTLAGPYELIQGGYGLIGRLPIHLTDSSGHDYFWGFTCVTINIPEGLSQAYMEKLEEQGYAYELWRISPDNSQKQIIMSSELPLSYAPVEQDIQLPNSVWTLSIAPAEGWHQINLLAAEITLSILFALLTGLLAKSVLDLAISRYDLKNTLRQQSANYKMLNEKDEDLRRFRHDISNHMLSLSHLLDKQDTAGAREYIHSFTGSLSDTARIINTENYVFDALLAQKLYEARQKGIHTEQEISIGRLLRISNEDWSTLFGNALDNAVEGCLRSGLPDPAIRVSVKYRGDMLHVCISNTAAKAGESADGLIVTDKADKRNHGLGLRQIQSVVRKYQGAMETAWEDGIFSLTFLLLKV